MGQDKQFMCPDIQVATPPLQAGDFGMLLLVDFTAAFDRAKKIKLFRKMLDKGIPPHVVRWFRAFLAERKGRVRVGDALSALREFVEGFPQGTVLGPICWDFFLDDIVEELVRDLPAGVRAEVVLYADDISVVLRAPSLEELYAGAQSVLDRLSGWEVANEARVSLEKTTVTVLTPGPTAVPKARRPRLWYPDQSAEPPFRGIRRLGEYAEQPKLLGVLYDENFTFAPHAKAVREKLQRRGGVVGALSGSSWGCDRRTLRATHLAYVQSKADYGLAAYAPF
eukprot:gene17968-biopygen4764